MVQTIRGRLWIGSLVVVALLVVAGAVAWRTLSTMSREITTTLRDVQTESRLASQLSSDAAKTLAAAARYLDTHDPDAEAAFRQHGWNAHDIQRAINARPDRTAEEVATVALIDAKLSSMEVRYARAHRLVDTRNVYVRNPMRRRTGGWIEWDDPAEVLDKILRPLDASRRIEAVQRAIGRQAVQPVAIRCRSRARSRIIWTLVLADASNSRGPDFLSVGIVFGDLCPIMMRHHQRSLRRQPRVAELRVHRLRIPHWNGKLLFDFVRGDVDNFHHRLIAVHDK